MSVEHLAWDSNWWGVRIGRAQGVEDLGEPGYACIWLLLPAQGTEAIHQAEDEVAQMMDVRVQYEVAPWKLPVAARSFKPEDVDSLAEIARTAFRGMTRFYADPKFPDERCDDLYENWLRESCKGWAAEVLVIGDGEQPAGFVTIHLNEKVADIGLIALREPHRNRGLGSQLASSAIGWAYRQGAEKMTVVTQGCNIASQRAFQKSGFLLASADVWMHQW